MSQFYRRYVPPTKDPSEQSQKTPETLGKRKRGGTTTTKVSEVDVQQEKSKGRIESEQINHQEGLRSKERHGTSSKAADKAKNVLEKYSVSHFARSQDEDIKIKPRRPKEKHVKRTEEDAIVNENFNQKTVEDDQHSLVEAEQERSEVKHVAVLRKYEKAKRGSNAATIVSQDRSDNLDEVSTSQDATLYGLEPIPQLEKSKPSSEFPSYSILPSWQARAITVEPTSTGYFEKLGLSKTTLANLQSSVDHKAFPIQSCVIPLLLAGPGSSDSDLCISAATGSGKTLAYVIPIVESLLRNTKPGLRAVIVVPTRELVTQVKDACEMCASGTRIRIVTAVGSKSIAEEQKALVEEEELYDPVAYERQANEPIDWTGFNLEKQIERACRRINDHDTSARTGYILRTRIKADILITTPGRLVDHLQNTEGFHLDDVEWLVVDEADRLLNESYQEWMTTTMPALRSRRATEGQDKVLSYMRMALPRRKIRKILLSATMTRDVSKLNQFDLYDPKLIVLKTATDGSIGINAINSHTAHQSQVSEGTDNYALPSSLQETAVVLKDGSEKPLLLLQLLSEHLGIQSTATTTPNRPRKVEKRPTLDQANGLSSSEDESTSSSGSDSSDSESDRSATTSSSSSQDENGRKPQDRSSVSQNRQTSTTTASPTIAKALIFTRSTASASRLSRLLSILSPSLAPRIATLTRSTASSASSRRALAMFRSGKVQVLVATDRASRGIDVPGLPHVISYDIPGSALTYIHRVGRTARAGLDGSAWTMVEHREGRWFWNEIGGKGDKCKISRTARVKRLHLELDNDIDVRGDSNDDDLKTRYEKALEILASEVRGS